MSSRTAKILKNCKELVPTSDLKFQQVHELPTSVDLHVDCDKNNSETTDTSTPYYAVHVLSTDLDEESNKNNIASANSLTPEPVPGPSISTYLDPKTNNCSSPKLIVHPTAHSSKFYIVESRTSTSIQLRNVPRLTYNDPNETKEHDDFSSGSSDNYSPGREHSSSDSEPPNENTPPEQTVFNTSEIIEDKENLPIPKKGKKRNRNPDNWINVKAKRLRNSGQSYTSKAGKRISERKMGKPCKEKCVLSCSKKIDEMFRAELFKEYWELGTLQRQRDFLASHIEKLGLKYRRISAEQPRNPNCAFYVPKEGQRIRVCKTFLINTLGITERSIRTVIKSRASGTGIVPTDNRGKHKNHRKIDEEILKSVRDHINSIPRVESHYLRKDTKREFIDGGLSISELYRNYSSQRSTANMPAASYDKYLRIFNTEFNIGFFLPKKDQCDLCEAYKNTPENEKADIENEYLNHHEEKDLSRKEKHNDKEKANNKEIVLAVYDLQAVLPVPTGYSSSFFYKSRLNCYNFTITEIVNDKSCCFFWHEGLGNRGVIEIASCVLLYLEEVSRTNPGADVVFYSDNCGGQQKNRYMISTYLYAVDYLEINSITHKYLVRGHTQNEGDAIHSIIEKSVKKIQKSGPIYVPDHYISAIRYAKKKGKPLEVKEMNFDDFLDLKFLHDEMALTLTKNTHGGDFKISEVKLLQIEKGDPFFRYKTSYKQEEGCPWSNSLKLGN